MKFPANLDPAGFLAGELLIYCRQPDSGVDCFRGGFQAEIEVHGVIDGVALPGGRSLHPFENVIVNLNAVHLLSRACPKLGQGGE